MHQAPAKLKEQFARVAVVLVLLHGIVDSLFGEAILQFKGGNWKAVDKEAEVKGELRLLLAVTELAADAEQIGGEKLRCSEIPRRGCAIEKLN